MAKNQGGPCIINHWIPDGAKDYPADRWTHRALLTESLDAGIIGDKTVSKKLCVDYVESKLFGIGSEEYVVGSAEYYSSYALSRGIGYCLDMGHWHPTEEITTSSPPTSSSTGRSCCTSAAPSAGTATTW
jgi:L-rhamnose isomerase